ncbi:UNVERIFIED_CONTAM: uncharacterized protein DUF3592 [Acetivibrio alkalicellulosi]
MNYKKTEWSIGIIFSVIGLTFIAAAVAVYISNSNFKKNAQETTATITDIYVYGSRGDTDHDVFVKYNVGGREYNQLLNYYTSSMYVGQEIKIYYDLNEPSRIRGASIMVEIILIILGAVFFLIGFFVIVIKIRNISKKIRLIESGYKVDAEFQEVILNTSYSVNRKNPYFITCKWKDPSSGETYIFRSENIWYDPQDIIEDLNITSFPVYIDQNNFKKYHVLLECLENKMVPSY